MTIWKSAIASIMLLAGFGISDAVSAGGAAEYSVPMRDTRNEDMARNDSASASNVGRCNALAGRALGVVHRIDQIDEGQEQQLCSNLLALFNTFLGTPNCFALLANGQLLPSHAVGQYQLACEVIRERCGVDPGDVACPFPSPS